MEWEGPAVLPSLDLPGALKLPAPIFDVPKGELPSYKPMVVPPSVLRPPPGVQGINMEEEPPKDEEETKTETKPVTPPIPNPPEAQIVEIPFTDLEVPMPSTIIMTTAVTTAFISVAATLTATSLFKYIVMVSKPIFKQAWNKLTKQNQNPEIS